RVGGVELEVSEPTASTLAHGGGGGKSHKLVLEPGELITSIEPHCGSHKVKTRLFYLKLSTN
ncbi:hypothetical protein PHYSODRAFT_374484, partial [Phytophthora sojae]